MILNNPKKAAFLKTIGFKLGKVKDFNSIEILGDDNKILKELEKINDAKVNPMLLLSEYGYITFLAKKNAGNN